MMNYTLFEIGSIKVCLWNLIAIAVIFLVAAVMRRIIHRSVKRYLIGVNFMVEGSRATWLRLLSQSVYILAFYLAIISFNINNTGVSVRSFVKLNIVDFHFIKINLYQLLMIGLLIVGARMMVNFSKLYFSKKIRSKEGYNPSTEFVYIQFSKYVIYTFSLLLALKSLNVNLTNLFIGSAALLVGIGLGLQDVFRDIVSGLILLFEGTVKIGDIVELKDPKFTQQMIAKIIRINVRTTQIETRDGTVLIVPNARLTQEYVENWSHRDPLTRFIVEVSVAYGSNTELVSKLMRQAALAHPRVKKSSPVIVRMKNFGDNGLELELVFWADQSWEANLYKSDIRFEIDRLFREYDIVIPYPQRTISYLKEEKKDGV